MRPYAITEKNIGDTPLQALEVFRTADPALVGVPLTYAGRLDPMASGKLLILIGNECKKRKQYDGLDKEYEFEVLLGFRSDTGDVLGLAETCGEAPEVSEKEIRDAVRSCLGEYRSPYPAFSSKTVGGVPIFHHAIKNTLVEIDIPMVSGTIHQIIFLGTRTVPRDELVEKISAKINLLHVDETDPRVGSGFRKSEISARWNILRFGTPRNFTIVKFRVVVSSGTYIRTLAPSIAEKLGTCGLAYSIHRTKIGRYFSLTKHFGFWRGTF
ncbi:MAG: hypothetical protein AAB511_01780 [Patescibacteria group bacterium]